MHKGAVVTETLPPFSDISWQLYPRGLHVAWYQDDRGNQKRWQGPCCQSSPSHRWPKQSHLKAVFRSYGMEIGTEVIRQEDMTGGWVLTEMGHEVMEMSLEWWKYSTSWLYVVYMSVCICQKWSNCTLRFTVHKLYFHYKKAILLLQEATRGAILIFLTFNLPFWYQLKKGSPEVPFLAPWTPLCAVDSA